MGKRATAQNSETERLIEALAVTLLKGKATQNALIFEHGVEDSLYGIGHKVRWAIVEMRRRGMIPDVHRCNSCGQALTRSILNKELELTEKGVEIALKSSLLKEMEVSSEG